MPVARGDRPDFRRECALLIECLAGIEFVKTPRRNASDRTDRGENAMTELASRGVFTDPAIAENPVPHFIELRRECPACASRIVA
jgi:hypothetical protein